MSFCGPCRVALALCTNSRAMDLYFVIVSLKDSILTRLQIYEVDAAHVLKERKRGDRASVSVRIHALRNYIL
jgi:hypothetical protein